MRPCALVPAFDAEATVGDVVSELVRDWPEPNGVLVIDDGSRDHTARVARRAGALVISHPRNLGKGAAIRTGLRAAFEQGFDVAVSVDADGQHPPEEAVRLLSVDADPAALVLGVRDFVAAGAPRKNQISNGISNFFLSLFARRKFGDTQCGLRRYPVAGTLALRYQDDGYAFEAEVILRAVAAEIRIIEVPIRVIYPPEGERVTHFDSIKDPARIVSRVVKTLVATRGLRRAPIVTSSSAARPSQRPVEARDLSAPPPPSAP
jgi:glycosyltransferase involved in cell wall biosynthesis